jgi:hypothetical protein
MYGFLADLIVGLHVAYVGFVIVGLLLILFGILLHWQWIRNPWFRLVHLLMILIVAFEALYDVTCPLTTWENDLRRAAGQDVQDVSFIGRMLDSILFYDASNEGALRIGYYAVAALIVATFFLVPPRLRRRPARPPLSAPHPGGNS